MAYGSFNQVGLVQHQHRAAIELPSGIGHPEPTGCRRHHTISFRGIDALRLDELDASLHAEAMGSSLIAALAALIGASIGGLTSVLASWLLQHRQVRVQWVGQEVNRRRDLYKEFIEDASKCYVDALH